MAEVLAFIGAMILIAMAVVAVVIITLTIGIAKALKWQRWENDDDKRSH